eukprot:scaffold11884_cov107-Phaeocystis_antarctica.AAC.1
MDHSKAPQLRRAQLLKYGASCCCRRNPLSAEQRIRRRNATRSSVERPPVVRKLTPAEGLANIDISGIGHVLQQPRRAPNAAAPRRRSAAPGAAVPGAPSALSATTERGSRAMTTSMLCRTKLGPIRRKTSEWNDSASRHMAARKNDSALLNGALSSTPIGVATSSAKLPKLISMSPPGACSTSSLSDGSEARRYIEAEPSTTSSNIHEPVIWRWRPM